MKFDNCSLLFVLAALTVSAVLADFAQDSCTPQTNWVPESGDALPTGKVRCCAGFYEGGAKAGSCDTSSCVNNFGAKNRNCFNYGSPEHPITVPEMEKGKPGGRQDAQLEPEIAGRIGGSAVCPYLKSDKAICDTSYYTALNERNCRTTDDDKVHCLGKVKCQTTGVFYPDGYPAGHSTGAEETPTTLPDPYVNRCSSEEFPEGSDCFYDGTSENWKVCKGYVGSIFGDPHIMSWSGEYFDYMGQCDLVLVDNPEFHNGLGFTAHIRAKTRYDFSYIEAAAIMIGDDILEVASYGDFFLNSVQGAEELLHGKATVGGFPVEYEMKNKKTHMFYIRMGKMGTIELKVYKHIVSIKFDDVQGYAFGHSKGLMGDFYTGQHLARDGSTVVDNDNEFGQEWQVNPDTEPLLFDSAPPAGKCVLPDIPYGAGARRLGENNISIEDAEAACAHLPEGQGQEQCIYDVIASGDLEIAEAGAF